MRRGAILVVLGLLVGRLQAETDSTQAELVRQADACMTRLEKIVEELSALEEAARLTNQVIRADCIRGVQSAVVGLQDGLRAIHKRLRLLAEEGDQESLQDSVDQILAGCRRAEFHLAEARNCREQTALPTGAPVRLRHRRHDELTDPAPPDVAGVQDRPLLKANCFRQEQLACLLMQAMELEVADTGRVRPCTEQLAHRQIEPLQPWDGTRCVTLDVFCVVVARAMNLPVEDPNDPASYQQALRDDGLPVELLMSPRPAQPVPDVSEDQARAFFGSGYAGTFRRHPPHP